MTEVRWFLSIQFSKSLVPWRAYQSRTLQPRCQALSMKCFGVFVAVPSVVGSATIRKVPPAVNPPVRGFFSSPPRRPEKPPTHHVAGRGKKKGEEFQGKEGMSWKELSTGWRAPR